MKTLPVTLVIPHRNRADEIKRCIKSLQESKTIPQEVFIIDDCSQAEQRQLLQEIISGCANLNIRLFLYDEHVGRSDAKNLGILKTRTPYIWFLDSDTEMVNPDALEAGYQLIDKNPAIGVVGGEIVEDSSRQRYIRETYLLKSLWSGFVDHPGGSDIQKEADIVPTCNFLTRTSLMKEIGGFHSKIEHGEDKLACLQIRELGYRIFLDSCFGVLHHQSSAERMQFFTVACATFRDTAFIYGATNNFWKLIAFHINCMLSVPKLYRNNMERYRIFMPHKAVLETGQGYGFWVSIKRLRDIGRLTAQYVLANKTYMSLKGYHFRLTNKKNPVTVQDRILRHSKRIVYTFAAYKVPSEARENRGLSLDSARDGSRDGELVEPKAADGNGRSVSISNKPWPLGHGN